MISIPAFPRIFALGGSMVRDILDGPIEITEKIDGSQFSFGMIEGELQYRTKGVLNDSVDLGMFGPIVEWCKTLTLPNDIVFHGEYLKSPKHNTLVYSKVPTNNFSLFGVRNMVSGACYPHENITMWANDFDCDVVPLLFEGVWEKDATDMLKLLEQESYLGGCQMEGFVIKNYNKPQELYGQYFPLTSAKYVSEAFKEKHSDNPEFKSKRDKVALIAEQYRGEPRWLKAIYKFRDEGILDNSPKDIGPLLKYINNDFLDEETDNIKEMLWKAFEGDIRKMVQRGFPEWYKEYLVKGMDDEET